MKVLVAVAIILLNACATTVAPGQSYRPANYSGPAWTISARAEEGALTDAVTVTINGQTVASGTLSEFRQRDNFTGSYDGHNILAECALVSSGQFAFAHECTVLVNNERAANLSF